MFSYLVNFIVSLMLAVSKNIWFTNIVHKDAHIGAVTRAYKKGDVIGEYTNVLFLDNKVRTPPDQ